MWASNSDLDVWADTVRQHPAIRLIKDSLRFNIIDYFRYDGAKIQISVQKSKYI
jgi:hypothetical protein